MTDLPGPPDVVTKPAPPADVLPELPPPESGDAGVIPKRPPWNQRVSNTLLMGTDDLLLGMLGGRALQLGHSRQQLAEALGISYSTLVQYASGQRPVARAEYRFFEACATYLDRPIATVLFASGALTLGKLREGLAYIKSLTCVMPRALEYIRNDPEYAGVAPSDLVTMGLPAQLQYFIIKLYESSTGVRLLPESIDILASVEEVTALEAQRQSQVVTAAPVPRLTGSGE